MKRGIQAVSPEELAVSILARCFPDECPEAAMSPRTNGRITLSAFQERAVNRAREAVRSWNGVLLCDAVGLGKTYVGVALIEQYTRAGTPALVAVPASLRNQWKDALSRAGIAPSAALLVTHTQLSRGYTPRLAGTAPRFLLVDEAHAFRNPRTRRYASLARLSCGGKVCLITATPVNNSLLDLYWLLRIWTKDDTFRSLGVPHLRALFHEVIEQANPSPPFGRVLRAVLIRRTRDDVRNEVARSRIRFPLLSPPAAVSYDPDQGVRGSHSLVLESIASLQLAAMGSSDSTLLRYVLLKRLESSVAALRATLERMRRFHVEFLDALADGFLLRVSDADALQFISDDQLYMRKVVLAPLSPSLCREALRQTAASDLRILDTMLDHLPHTSDSDDKLAQLSQLLFERLDGNRVLVFTEFRETALYLWRHFVPRGGIAMISGEAAMLGRGRSSRTAVLERFAAPLRSSRIHAREAVRVLIATDVLAEGLNLQECAHVVSYDLPWNPVRLIQRIGRIDRLGSPHAQVHAYNFVPGQQLEKYLAILRRLHIKLHAIALGLGADQPVLGTAAEGRNGDGTWKDLMDVPNGLRPPACRSDASSREERLRAQLRDCLADGARNAQRAHTLSLPVFSRVTASTDRDRGVFVAVFVDGSHLRAFRICEHQQQEVDPLDLAELCRNAPHQDGCMSDRELVAIRRALRRIRALALPETRGTVMVDRLSVAHAAARSVHVALSREPGGPDPADAAQAERILATLSAPLSIHTELRLKSCHLVAPGLHTLLADLNDALFEVERPFTGPRQTPAERHSGPSRLRLAAALSVV